MRDCRDYDRELEEIRSFMALPMAIEAPARRA